MILPSFYNAPVSYFATVLHSSDKVIIEQFDHYSKQTYRNRCRILGSNGVIVLSIPVINLHGSKVLMKDIRIDYSTSWNKNHWKSIVSAYASAPFFEFVEDSFSGYYSKRYTFLIDLNTELFLTVLNLLQVEVAVSKSSDYKVLEPGYDFRECIHPKRVFKHREFRFHPTEYYQVFSERHGFKRDLSILDLLFNEGANSSVILSNSMSHKKTRSE